MRGQVVGQLKGLGLTPATGCVFGKVFIAHSILAQ